jgi:hypothetical protein
VVTISGHAWRSTVTRCGDEYFLPVNRANRTAAGRRGRRREWVEWVAEAKRPETRDRRVRGVVEQVCERAT